MKALLIHHELTVSQLETERLILIPYTKELCKALNNGNYHCIEKLGLKAAQGWPDEEFLETLHKIVINLSKVDRPTGFESWMIVRKDTKELIGDAGFKGFNSILKSCDLGYGIVESHRKQGFALEATKALVDWALSHSYVEKITAACLKNNLASQKILQHLHFKNESESDDMYFWELYK